eukprot:9313196-Pyramimonas_sp.AAC.1
MQLRVPHGYETKEGARKLGPSSRRHRATGAFGGAPYGAAKRVKGVPKWVVGGHADPATGAF